MALGVGMYYNGIWLGVDSIKLQLYLRHFGEGALF